MKTKYYIFLIILFLFTGLIIGCTSNVEETLTGNTCFNSETCGLENNNSLTEINIDKLEIYHFHATNQCVSCIAVGDLAEETVNTYFKDELKTGKIVFNHINADLYENKDLVIKYGVTGSSLWLGTYNDGKFNAEQNTNVWYKINDEQDYMTYLKSIIEQKLAGDLL